MVIENFLNPTFAYLLLVAGFWLIIMAILTPGTGFFEIGALFALVLAGWQVYNLPINWWALVILVIGVIPFLAAVQKSGKIRYLVLSILALVIGSTFLFQGESWKPAVNPFLALVVSILTSGFMWLATVKTLEARAVRPSHDLARLIGATGITRTPVHINGTVLIKMEEWSARSEEPIPSNTQIKVLERDGFTLIIRPLVESNPVPDKQIDTQT